MMIREPVDTRTRLIFLLEGHTFLFPRAILFLSHSVAISFYFDFRSLSFHSPVFLHIL